MRGGARLGAPVLMASASAVLFAGLRRRSLAWGASVAELDASLPGDELIPRADITATRAVTVQAAAAQVWPWIAQLGQGRAGFYSYEFLENLAGCDMHNADRIVADWQTVRVGAKVHLHPEVALDVAGLEQGRSMVLRGGIPMGDVKAPYDFTWAFVLRDAPGGATRLVVRERYEYSRWWAPLIVEPIELISLIMSRRMLRGVKARAESASPQRRPRPRREKPMPPVSSRITRMMRMMVSTGQPFSGV